jgi:hypothetical protein
MMITLALLKVIPSNSGLNCPLRPAIIVESRTYVVKAITGM